MLHTLMSSTLCKPDDVSLDYFSQEKYVGMVVPSGEGAISLYFTNEGMGRIYDELSVLSVIDNPVWPVPNDQEIADFGRRLADGSAFAEVPLPEVDGEADDAEEMRAAFIENQKRLIGYLMTALAQGRIPFRLGGT